MEGSDADVLKSAADRLSKAAMKIGEQMYKAQAEAGSGGPGGDAGPGASAHADDKVVDAEFEEVDDKKKSA